MKSADVFLENLALLISSGMPVYEALSSLADEAGTRKLKKLSLRLAEEVKNGQPISAALTDAKLFPARYVSLVALGEETGRLSEELKLIVADMRKDRIFKSKVRNALLYPGMVSLVTIAVGLVSVWYTFPKLIGVISQIGGPIPPTTQVIVDIGSFFRDYGAVAVPWAIAVIFALSYLLFFEKRTKIAGERLLFMLPFARSMVVEIEIARMGHALGVLLPTGLGLPQSLAYLRESTPRVLYRRLYAALEKDVIDGVPLSEAIARYPRSRMLIPSHVRQLAAAGEQSGNLAQTFSTIGELYQEKTDNVAQGIGAILEPVIIIFIGLAVAFVALAIISPIYGLVNQL